MRISYEVKNGWQGWRGRWEAVGGWGASSWRGEGGRGVGWGRGKEGEEGEMEGTDGRMGR